MEAGWINKKKLDTEMPPSIKSLIKDAWYAECWIYQKSTKRWYTPQEFKQQWQSLFRTSIYKSDLSDNFDDFTIRSPYVGLTERIKALKRVTEEVTAFKEKIDQYYQVELRRK